MSDAWDELMGVDSDLKHLVVLVEVTTDMAIEMVLSPGAAPSDRAALDNIVSMLWIVRDLTTRLYKDLDASTAALAKERQATPLRMVGGERNEDRQL